MSTFNLYNGFPTPGPQNSNLNDVMDEIYFATEQQWKWAQEYGDFDYVVVGSGFCALAFIDKILREHKTKKILVLEKGSLFLPEHFQNLPPVFTATLPNQVYKTELFPWSVSKISSELEYANWMHGMVPFFGGRSVLWSAWCPIPHEDKEELNNWPQDIKDMMNEEGFYDEAKDLLYVKNTNDPSLSPIFGILQESVMEKISAGIENGDLPNSRCEYAPLAIGDKYNRRNDFTKYSVVPDFLELIVKDIANAKAIVQKARKKEKTLSEEQIRRETLLHRRLLVVTNCTVEKIYSETIESPSEYMDTKKKQVPLALETTRGVLPLAKHNQLSSKLILAMGCMPPATLLLNSFDFPDPSKRPGLTFGAHFITAAFIRIPRSHFSLLLEIKLELGAIYLAGVEHLDDKYTGQYHHQITVIHDPDNDRDGGIAHRYMPDVVATASEEQLRDSQDYAVLVFASLGEMDLRNPDNGLTLNRTQDPTCNVTLKWSLNDSDQRLWDTMDENIHEVAKLLGDDTVEYWDMASSEWVKPSECVPIPPFLRVDGMVHESSVIPFGKVVNSEFQLDGIEDVYVTGSGMWPTAASWNPTLSMCAFAQRLATQLLEKEKEE